MTDKRAFIEVKRKPKLWKYLGEWHCIGIADGADCQIEKPELVVASGATALKAYSRWIARRYSATVRVRPRFQ